MDWSLFQAKPKYPFLRKNMVYPAPWVSEQLQSHSHENQPYYAAMFLDPVLRFAWIFYAIYPDRIQHAADTSFFIGLAEVFRRFIWNFFRVENEEIYNRQHLKVAHQINLPFSNIARPPSEAPAAPSSSSTSVRENISNRHREDFTVKPSIDCKLLRAERITANTHMQTWAATVLQRIMTTTTTMTTTTFTLTEVPTVLTTIAQVVLHKVIRSLT